LIHKKKSKTFVKNLKYKGETMRYVISQTLYNTYAESLGTIGKVKVMKNGKPTFIDKAIPADFETVLAYVNEMSGILGGVTQLSIENDKR
jgi:hypothetical protein